MTKKHMDKPSDEEIQAYLGALNRIYTAYRETRKEATGAGYRAAQQWFTNRGITVVFTGGPNNPHWELETGGSGQPNDDQSKKQ